MTATPYAGLTPDVMLDAIESLGLACTGAQIALASYENRVYQVALEEGFVVAKFYRPGRWSDAAIVEEHDFALELEAADLPVVAPLVLHGESLHEFANFRFALFPRRGGHWPELGTPEERQWMGRVLGRIHAIGAQRAFRERPALTLERFGAAALEQVTAGGWVPEHLRGSYAAITEDLLGRIEALFAEHPFRAQRIHGDCHPGNILWTDDGPHFVDLDDCMSGPAVQDLWLFLSGHREEMQVQLADLLEGYSRFRDFDFRELNLIEALRTLRLLHYNAWIARRWEDPAFPRAFPWFTDNRFWEEHVLALREQRAALDEPVLAVF